MEHYLTQLYTDLETAILQRWRIIPPHFYEMGVPERWLDPPQGWNGPPFGFGHEEDEAIQDTYLQTLEFEKTLAEVETFLHERPKVTMYDHFGFEPEQFPTADQLNDEQLEILKSLLCRLWAAYNLTPVFSENTPGRIIYPLLLKRMAKATMIFKRGIIGVEFCDYDPIKCPFGAEWCTCKGHQWERG